MDQTNHPHRRDAQRQARNENDKWSAECKQHSLNEDRDGHKKLRLERQQQRKLKATEPATCEADLGPALREQQYADAAYQEESGGEN